MKKHLLIITALLFVPSVAFASWWNPASWGIFSFLFHTNPQEEIISVATSSSSKLTDISTSTALVIATSTEATTSRPKADVIVKKTTPSLQPTTTMTPKMVATPQVSASTLIGSSTLATTTTVEVKAVDKGIPYLGQDGNWYYPNAYDENGRNLQAPKPKTASISSVAMYPISDKLNVARFNIIGENDIFTLNTLTVHFSISGPVQITNVYLYQGDYIPLASAVISNNIAVFKIPSGINGASFGSDIPTQFSINADITGTTTITFDCRTLDRRTIYAGQYTPPQFMSQFSITSVISGTGIELRDSTGASMAVEGEAKNMITLGGPKCL